MKKESMSPMAEYLIYLKTLSSDEKKKELEELIKLSRNPLKYSYNAFPCIFECHQRKIEACEDQDILPQDYGYEECMDVPCLEMCIKAKKERWDF